MKTIGRFGGGETYHDLDKFQLNSSSFKPIWKPFIEVFEAIKKPTDVSTPQDFALQFQVEF